MGDIPSAPANSGDLLSGRSSGRPLCLSGPAAKLLVEPDRIDAEGLDGRVRSVLERLELEDARERARGLPPEQRSRAVAPTTGRFLFALARDKVEPGAVVIADNVLSHVETLGAYSEARQADPTLSSVTVPLDRGLEITVVLRGSL